MKAEITEFSSSLLGFPTIKDGFRIRLEPVGSLQESLDIINYLAETFGKKEGTTDYAIVDEGRYFIMGGEGWAVSRGLTRTTSYETKQVSESYNMFIVLDSIDKVSTVVIGLGLCCESIDKSQTLDYNISKVLHKVKAKLTDKEVRRVKTAVSMCLHSFGHSVPWYDIELDTHTKTVGFRLNNNCTIKTYRF